MNDDLIRAMAMRFSEQCSEITRFHFGQAPTRIDDTEVNTRIKSEIMMPYQTLQQPSNSRPLLLLLFYEPAC